MNEQQRNDFECAIYFDVALNVHSAAADGLTILEITSDSGFQRIFLDNDQLRVLIELLERKRMGE